MKLSQLALLTAGFAAASPASATYAVFAFAGSDPVSIINGDTFATDAYNDTVDGTTQTADASADVASGTLRAYASVANGQSTITRARAAFGDTLVFSGVPDSVFTVTLRMVVNGSVAGNRDNRAAAQIDIRDPTLSFVVGGGTVQPFVPPFANWTFSNFELELPVSVLPTNGSAIIPFYVQLGVETRGLQNVVSVTDFGHTALLEIDSPYAFTSSSGVLLSAPIVPLPAPLLLLASGLLGFLGVGCRKRFAH
jgi:hypothetical protein